MHAMDSSTFNLSWGSASLKKFWPLMQNNPKIFFKNESKQNFIIVGRIKLFNNDKEILVI